MDRTMTQRGLMAALGAVAGLCLYILGEIIGRDLVPERLALGLAVFGAVFFFGLLGMAGPLQVGRAALGALGVGLVVALLLVVASFRFDRIDGLLQSPFPVLAATVLAMVPLPFFIASCGPGWRDYPVLFTQSWTIVVRYAAAGLFVGVVWGVIFLSDALLSIVGLGVIGDLIDVAVVPWLVTGTVLGLALAVVTEMSDLVSPYLLLRLLRLLLPVLLVVMTVFVVALPVKGLSGLLGGLSVAATLLTMAGAAATLVTTAADQSDEDAVQGVWMARAARGLGVLVLIFAVLAGWAVWQRVAEYGWTPARLFAALACALALGYGLVYTTAILAGAGWMGRVRQGNVVMAVVLMVAAVGWLSVLNPQAISARDQFSRFEAGVTKIEDLDIVALESWGHAGAAAVTQLRALATEPGHEALVKHLAQQTRLSPDKMRAALLVEMPVRPEAAVATRASVVAALQEWELNEALKQCRKEWEPGVPGCVLVVGDFWPDVVGDEAMRLVRDPQSGQMVATGYVGDGAGLSARPIDFGPKGYPTGDEAQALIRRALEGTPELVPSRRKSLRLGAFDIEIQR